MLNAGAPHSNIQSRATQPNYVFPDILISVVGVVWGYAGISPEEMSQRVVSPNKRAFTTTVSNIEHIESQSLKGTGLTKVFFQPGTNPGGVA